MPIAREPGGLDTPGRCFVNVCRASFTLLCPTHATVSLGLSVSSRWKSPPRPVWSAETENIPLVLLKGRGFPAPTLGPAKRQVPTTPNQE